MKRKAEQESPNYYAVIPSPVLNDKRLSYRAKVMFAVLSSLTSKEGYAWASNKYLADFFETSERTISRIIRKLEDCGHIKTEYTRDSHRKIFTVDIGGGVDKNIQGGVDKNVQPPSTELSMGVDKNVHHNTKANNINLTLSQRFQKSDLALETHKASIDFADAVEKICEGNLFLPAETTTFYFYRRHLSERGPEWLRKATKKLRSLTTWRDSKPGRGTTDIKKAFGAWMVRVAGYKKKEIK